MCRQASGGLAIFPILDRECDTCAQTHRHTAICPLSCSYVVSMRSSSKQCRVKKMIGSDEKCACSWARGVGGALGTASDPVVRFEESRRRAPLRETEAAGAYRPGEHAPRECRGPGRVFITGRGPYAAVGKAGKIEPRGGTRGSGKGPLLGTGLSGQVAYGALGSWCDQLLARATEEPGKSCRLCEAVTSIGPPPASSGKWGVGVRRAAGPLWVSRAAVGDQPVSAGTCSRGNTWTGWTPLAPRFVSVTTSNRTGLRRMKAVPRLPRSLGLTPGRDPGRFQRTPLAGNCHNDGAVLWGHPEVLRGL